MTEQSGYRGKALEALKKAAIEVGDRVRIVKKARAYEGLLIPRSGFHNDEILVLKLANGYNIGVLLTPNARIERIGKGAAPSFSKPTSPRQRPRLPSVAILSTGGTIASRVDYRTGGVRPALTASDLYSVVPELSEIARIETEILFSIFSENITPSHWSQMAEHVANAVKGGIQGVVVAHGTDTMGYTAAALSFALQGLPVPVILVGSQRSADRPSSDAASNLVGAVAAAGKAPFAEVAVAMHETVADKSIVFHRGTRVRKCHTSRRDAFKSINAPALARYDRKGITMETTSYQRRDTSRELTIKPAFEEKIALVKFSPGVSAQVINWYVNNDYKGIILEGTGLGHVGHQTFSALNRAIERQIVVGMTSQCIWGRVNMNVYDTGRDLLEIGVLPLADMLPETALVKLMWTFGQTDDVEKAQQLLLENIAHEFSPRTLFKATDPW